MGSSATGLCAVCTKPDDFIKVGGKKAKIWGFPEAIKPFYFGYRFSQKIVLIGKKTFLFV